MILTMKKNDCDAINTLSSILSKTYRGIILKTKNTPQNNKPQEIQNFGSCMMLLVFGRFNFP